MEKYDLVVIGSGPAGRRAAVQAAKLGKRVLVIEGRQRVGGVSVHTGTIPSKTLRETALNLSGWRERGFYGDSYRVKQDIDGGDLSIRLAKTLEHEVNVLEHQFHRNQIQTMTGVARFGGPNELIVLRADGSEVNVEGERILIAVGTVPHRPANIPFDDVSVIDSDRVVEMPRVGLVGDAGDPAQHETAVRHRRCRRGRVAGAFRGTDAQARDAVAPVAVGQIRMGRMGRERGRRRKGECRGGGEHPADRILRARKSSGNRVHVSFPWTARAVPARK